MTKVKVIKNTPVPLGSRKQLEISALQLDQRELMGADVNLPALYLQLRGFAPIDVVDRTLDVVVHRTVSGASTIEVKISDVHRDLLRSGALGKKLDIEIEGLWWRMKQVKKNGNGLVLIFEDREIAVLRTYAKPLKASAQTSRSKITRAQFVLRMLRDVQEFKIPVWIPELKRKQPIGSATAASPDALLAYNAQHRSFGISAKAAKSLYITDGSHRAPLTASQTKIANIILDVGASRLYARPILVMAMMCAIQESHLINNGQPHPGDFGYLSSNPNNNPVGVFSQIKRYVPLGATRDVATDAGVFYNALADLYATHPGTAYETLIEDVQHSGLPKMYAKRRTDAERIVTAYGMPSSDLYAANGSVAPTGSSGDYEFYRGVPPVQGQNSWLPENTWDCIQRLASEVNFRAFFVSGTFYYVSDADLYGAEPRMHITEGKDGVEFIDGDYDENKKVGVATVNCRIGRWNAPPGAVVEMYDMGVWDGKWLITDVERSLFNDNGTISLEKPHPALPEPISDSFNNNRGGLPLSGLGSVGLPLASKNQGPTQAQFGGILPKELQGTRAGVVQIAKKALAIEAKWHYCYPKDEGGDGSSDARPIPSSLWSQDAHDGIDCSAFATDVYREAGMDDPNGPSYNYNGAGNTSTLTAHGTRTSNPQPGDLVMYGKNGVDKFVSWGYPHHVTVYIGNDEEIGIGWSNGVVRLPVGQHNSLYVLGYVTYPFAVVSANTPAKSPVKPSPSPSPSLPHENAWKTPGAWKVGMPHPPDNADPAAFYDWMVRTDGGSHAG